MKLKDGFRLRAAIAVTVAAALAACNSSAPSSPSPQATAQGTAPSDQTAAAIPQVSFADIDLPEAKLSITRESRSTSPNEVLRLTVKVADSAQSRSKGLMGVPDVPSSAGMVFLYNLPVKNSFHMQNTLVPLDIAFWGEDRKIHQIMKMTPCKADPCEKYEPQSEFVGALEVKAGLFREKAVREGDSVTVTVQTEGEPAAG